MHRTENRQTRYRNYRSKVAIACSVFFIVIALLELGARLIEPDSYPLLRLKVTGGRRFIVANEHSKVIASDPFSGIRKLQIELGSSRRPVIGVGESTMFGFGYSHNGSFFNIAETLIEDAVGDRAELPMFYNCGVPGHGFQTITQIVRELVDLGLQDAIFVVQSAHNETLPFVLSRTLANRDPRFRLMMWLRRNSRFFAVIGDWYWNPASIDPSYNHVSQSLKYELLDSNRSHLKTILNLAARSGSKVLLCTATSNEQDQPSGFTFLDDYDSKNDNEFKRLRLKANRKFAVGDWPSAAALFEQCIALTGGEANSLFWLGKTYQFMGENERAGKAFRQARNLDGATWRPRAWDAINELFLTFAKDNGIAIVDLDAVSRSISEGGVPGPQQFLDNCHPTFETAIHLGLEFARVLLPVLYPSQPIQTPPLKPTEYYVKRRQVSLSQAAHIAIYYYLERDNPRAAQHHFETLDLPKPSLKTDLFRFMILAQLCRISEATVQLQKIIEHYPPESIQGLLTKDEALLKLIRRVPSVFTRLLMPGHEPFPMQIYPERFHPVIEKTSKGSFDVKVYAPAGFRITIAGRESVRVWSGQLKAGIHSVVATDETHYGLFELMLPDVVDEFHVVSFVKLPESLHVEGTEIFGADGSPLVLVKGEDRIYAIDPLPARAETLTRMFPEWEVGERDGFALVHLSNALQYLASQRKRIARLSEFTDHPSPSPSRHRLCTPPGDANSLEGLLKLMQAHYLAQPLAFDSKSIPQQLMPFDPWSEFVSRRSQAGSQSRLMNYRSGTYLLGPVVDLKTEHMAGFRGVIELETWTWNPEKGVVGDVKVEPDDE